MYLTACHVSMELHRFKLHILKGFAHTVINAYAIFESILQYTILLIMYCLGEHSHFTIIIASNDIIKMMVAASFQSFWLLMIGGPSRYHNTLPVE